MSKPKLDYQDLSNMVSSMRKTEQDNVVTDHTGMAYAKNDES